MTIGSMSVPEWARTGNFAYARFDGGPAEVSKALLSNWEYMHYPIAVQACDNLYDDPRALNWLEQAGVNVVWLTWSVGFSWEAEAIQRKKCARFVERFHAIDGHCMAYLSLANIFRESFERDLPQARTMYQYGAEGSPIPYGAAKYYGNHITRVMGCLNNPRWIEYQYRRVDAAIDAGFDGIFWDNCAHQCRSCPICLEKLAERSRQALGKAMSLADMVDMAQRRKNLISQNKTAMVEALLAEDESRVLRDFDHETVGEFLANMMARAHDRKADIVMTANAHQVELLNRPMNAINTENGIEPCMLPADKELLMLIEPWRDSHQVGLERLDKRRDNLELYAGLHEQADGYKPIIVEGGLRRGEADLGGGRLWEQMESRSLARSIYEAAMLGGSFQIFMEGDFLAKLHQEQAKALDQLRVAGVANRFLREYRDAFYDVVGLPNMSSVLRGEGTIQVEVSDDERVLAIAVRKASDSRYFLRVLNYDDTDVGNLAITVKGIRNPCKATVTIEPEYGGNESPALVKGDTVYVKFERLGLFALVEITT